MKDPFDGMGGEERPDAERPNNFFWKPNDASYMVGQLDRIEPGKQYGDYAVFTGAVIFRGEDHKPMADGDRAIPCNSASLTGKIVPEDAGKFFRITFEKWVNTANGRMRVYSVTVGLDPKKAEAILAKARKALAAENTAPDASTEDDDLPF